MRDSRDSFDPDEEVTDAMVELVDLTDTIDAAYANLGAEDQAVVDASVATMAAADRQYAMTLAALREAVGLTQTELARKCGVPQSRISEREHSGDMLVSTLSSYLTGLGLRARLVVEIGDHSEVAVDLDALSVSR